VDLITVSITHATAPIAVRERIAVASVATATAVADLQHRLAGPVRESALLSTCNRTEIYAAVDEPDQALAGVTDWLAHSSRLSRAEILSHLHVMRHSDAVRHAFRVASGLDSMVLGEPQILGQMKQAARDAQDAGALGAHLHQLFQRSFAVAKEVRTRTAIGSRSVSTAAAAVRTAERVLGDLSHANVLFVGAGEMIELAATHFAARRPQSIAIANRTLERGHRLALRVGARPMPLFELAEALPRYDVVVSCTASTLPIIGLGMVERAVRARGGRSLLMIDLAVPRDIEPEVARLPGVTLFTIDDLGALVQEGVAARRAAAEEAETIIEQRVGSFMQWLAGRDTVSLLRELDRHAERVRETVVRQARRQLARGEPVEAVLDALAERLSNKFLHSPRALLSSGTLTAREADQFVGRLILASSRRR
jgi:glutamyl-tRNA reductase